MTGSNAVNVFLGIGVAWTLAASYHAINGTQFRVEVGSLASSVSLFLVGSTLVFALLQWRRYNPLVRAELGGPLPYKLIAASVMIMTWILYITYCTLVAYCFVPSF